MPTAELPTVCAACKKAGVIEVSQSISGSHLRWSEHFSCPCGHGFAAGEVGLPPEGVRKALLAVTGTQALWLDDAAGREGATKVLVALLSRSLEEAQALLVTLPARLYEGTPVEVDFLVQGLEKLKVPGVRRA